MKTTVVIPNYNGIKYLEDCLDSICFNNKETPVIVVDNGSNDESVSFIKEKYPKVLLLELNENTGFANAVNVGIREAKTPYVFLLNNDTKIFPDTINALESAMEELKGEGKTVFSVQACMIQMREPQKLDGAGDYYCALGWGYSRGKGKKTDKYSKCDRIFSSCAGAALYDREAALAMGLFDELHFAYLEDLDLGYRANLAGYANYFAPKARVLHAGSASSGSRYNKFKVDLSSRNSIYLIRKNMPFFQRLINIPFFITGFGIKTLFFIMKGMGGVYLKGLLKGFRLSLSKEGRAHKVIFHGKNLTNYLYVQGCLWVNIFRRIWM